MSIKNYTPGDHYHPTCGYRAKEIALDAGRRAAQVIDRTFSPLASPEPVRLVVVDRSTATLAVTTSFYSIGTQLEIWNYKYLAEPQHKDPRLLSRPPEDCFFVMVDDYYNAGKTLKAASRFLGRKLDLAIYIMTSGALVEGAWREYVEQIVDLNWETEREKSF